MYHYDIMGVIRKPITDEEIRVAKISLSQPVGQVDTICERIRRIYSMAKQIEEECLSLTVYARRVDAKLQGFYKQDYEI